MEPFLPSPRVARRDEAGFGMLSSALGSIVALSFLLFSVHVMLSLYTRSVAGAAAFDGARIVAAGGSLRDARQRVDVLLGRLHPDVRVVPGGPGEIVLRVSVKSPGFSFPIAGNLLDSFRTVVREAHVRYERVQ